MNYGDSLVIGLEAREMEAADALAHIVLASRASRHCLNIQTLENHPSGQPKLFVRNVSFYHRSEFFHINLISMARRKIVIFQWVHTCLWLHSEYFVVFLEIKDVQKFTIANFGHTVSSSCLSKSCRHTYFLTNHCRQVDTSFNYSSISFITLSFILVLSLPWFYH